MFNMEMGGPKIILSPISTSTTTNYNSPGNYTITVPTGASVKVTLNGAGGGGGGYYVDPEFGGYTYYGGSSGGSSTFNGVSASGGGGAPGDQAATSGPNGSGSGGDTNGTGNGSPGGGGYGNGGNGGSAIKTWAAGVLNGSYTLSVGAGGAGASTNPLTSYGQPGGDGSATVVITTQTGTSVSYDFGSVRTFDSTSAMANFVGQLSGDKLTVALPSAANINGAIRGTNAASGKVYCEFTVQRNGGLEEWQIGLSSKAATMPLQPPIVLNTVPTSGNSDMCVFLNGSLIRSPGNTWVTSNPITLMMALDQPNKKVWFGYGGVWFDGSNPATNTGGYSLSSLAFSDFCVHIYAQTFGSSFTNSSGTINFGATTFLYTPPTGFGGW